MPLREVKRVCYDAEYLSTLECPGLGQHSASIAALGAVGVVPESGFVHGCGCVSNGFERRMIRDFKDRLGSGNSFFLEEVKARLCRYMFSSDLPAGVNLYIPNHGLIVYYNWAYAQKTMIGRLQDGMFFPPSSGEDMTGDLPKNSPSLVFPFLFGVSGTATTLGALMGSTRELARGVLTARARSKYRSLRNGKQCICDVTVYVLHGRLPILNDFMPCGCKATKEHIKGVERYLYDRSDEVRYGGQWELDFSTFARVLRRTGVVLHWEKGLGVLCLFSTEVIQSNLVLTFHPDRLEVRCDGSNSNSSAAPQSSRLDRLIQRSYFSALPTCRYLQYH